MNVKQVYLHLYDKITILFSYLAIPYSIKAESLTSFFSYYHRYRYAHVHYSHKIDTRS